MKARYILVCLLAAVCSANPDNSLIHRRNRHRYLIGNDKHQNHFDLNLEE